MPVPYENWTVPELTAAAKETGVAFSLDERGKLQVEGVSRATPAGLVSYITQRWVEIEQYLREHPQP
jgi:hypothetical protein